MLKIYDFSFQECIVNIYIPKLKYYCNRATHIKVNIIATAATTNKLYLCANAEYQSANISI